MADTTSCAAFPPSPVPSDARLWPEEQPFTAFGQFGEDMLDLRVFDQAIYWVNRTGEPHLIADMDEAYVGNAIAFLIEFQDMYFSDTQRDGSSRRWGTSCYSGTREATSLPSPSVDPLGVT